jgi:hypothetical protein
LYFGIGDLYADAHGYLYSPRSRNFVAHEEGLDWGATEGVPMKEYCHHCLNTKLSTEVCGRSGERSYDLNLDSTGKPMPWNSQATYVQGDIITVKSYLSTHHYGHMELRLCPDGENPTVECFNNHVAEFVNDPQFGAPKDPNYVHYGHYADRTHYDYEMKFKLPDDVVGQKVLMQWKYITANSCNPAGYVNYNWPDPSWWNPSLGLCKPLPWPEDGTRPSGVPEQFWNCAEITILPSTPTKSPKPSNQLTSPPTKTPTSAPTSISKDTFRIMLKYDDPENKKWCLQPEANTVGSAMVVRECHPDNQAQQFKVGDNDTILLAFKADRCIKRKRKNLILSKFCAGKEPANAKLFSLNAWTHRIHLVQDGLTVFGVSGDVPGDGKQVKLMSLSYERKSQFWELSD